MSRIENYDTEPKQPVRPRTLRTAGRLKQRVNATPNTVDCKHITTQLHQAFVNSAHYSIYVKHLIDLTSKANLETRINPTCILGLREAPQRLSGALQAAASSSRSAQIVTSQPAATRLETTRPLQPQRVDSTTAARDIIALMSLCCKSKETWLANKRSTASQCGTTAAPCGVRYSTYCTFNIITMASSILLVYF